MLDARVEGYHRCYDAPKVTETTRLTAAVEGLPSPPAGRSSNHQMNTTAAPTPHWSYSDADLSRGGIVLVYACGLGLWAAAVAAARRRPEPRRNPRLCASLTIALVYALLLWDTIVHELGHCFWFETFVGGREPNVAAPLRCNFFVQHVERLISC